jgi:hypothetical protein
MQAEVHFSLTFWTLSPPIFLPLLRVLRVTGQKEWAMIFEGIAHFFLFI